MEAIKRFQADFGLEPDAVIRPGGPTERALSMALRARDRQGPAAMEALRDTFAQRSRAGLTFRPHPRDRNAGQWVDATGRTLTDAQADAFAARPGQQLAMMWRDQQLRKPGQNLLEGGEGQDDLSTAGPGTARKEAGPSNPVTPEILRRRARVKAITRPTGVLKPEHAPEEFLDRVEGYNRRRYVEEWRKKGWHQAVDKLERYHDGSGEDLRFTRDEARTFRPIREAEWSNQMQFKLRTFLADTSDDEFNEKLKKLQDGKTIKLRDHWDSAYAGARAAMGAAGVFDGEEDFYRAFGRTPVQSRFEGEATRKGDIVYFEGEVTHNWDDKYDFNVLQPGYGDSQALEGEGRAKPFAFGATWKQRVHGTARRLSNGKLTDPQVEWTDLDQRT